MKQYPTLYASAESDESWLAVALAWTTTVDVPLPGALRIVAEPHCRVWLFSMN